MTKYLTKKIKDERGVWIPVYGKTPEELEEKVRRRLEEIEAAKELASNPYVYQYAKQWYDNATRGLSYKRREDYANIINNHICPYIGQMHMSEITPDIIDSLMEAEAGYSRSLQDKLVSALRKIITAAYKEGVIKASPCVDLKAGGKKPAEKDALTAAQQKTLLDTVRGLPIEGFVLLGLYSGLRREEILALKWDCIELEGDAPHLKVRRALRWEHNRPNVSEQLKSPAARREVPLPSVLVDWLRPLQPEDKNGYLFTDSNGEPWTETIFRNSWRAITRRQTGTVTRIRRDPATGKPIKVVVEKRLGDKIPNSKLTVTIDFAVSPHILRHTYATSLILAGTNVKVVQYLLGHEKVDTTLNIYTHLMERSAAANIGAVRAAFG